MKIVTLGTSHGNPTREHYCTSVLIQAADKNYLLDAGEPANATLVRRGLCAARLSGIFVTHMHIDHTGSLPVLCEQAEKYRLQYPEVQLKVFLPEERAVAGLNAWRAANHSNRFVPSIILDSYAAGRVYEDELLQVEAFPTGHMDYLNSPGVQSYALKMQNAGRKVLFTGDLMADFSDFPLAVAQGCDAVFCELTHYKLAEAIPTLTRLRIGTLYFYHLHDPWQTPEGEKEALRLCAALPYPVKLTYDGFEVEL